jgi:hypothetical protein
MASVIDICNMALSRIGNSQRINALDEASIQAEQCSLFYELARDFVLRDYAWNFARAYASLAQVADTNDPGYPYAYAIPTDCLKIRQIVNNVFPAWYGSPFNDCLQRPNVQAIPYRVSGQVLATSITPVTLEYTQQVTNPELFDPMFVSALAWRLGAHIAPALAKDQNIAQGCEAMYRAEIAQAAAAMLNEGASTYMAESSFITGRY